MQCVTVYLQAKGRKPVRIRPVVCIGDAQQEVPAGWCIACRRELFDPARELCRRCERKIDNEKTSESL